MLHLNQNSQSDSGASRPTIRGPSLLARRFLRDSQARQESQPNQLWSWDIGKLPGPAKWAYFYLYVILDVFSRYVTGWMVAYRESAELAKRL